MEYGATPVRRTVVLVTDGIASQARAAALARAAGLAVAEDHAVADVAGLADHALAADLLFVEVDEDPGAIYDALLDRVARLARGGQAVVVATPADLIDATDARLGDAPVLWLCGGQAAERLATVAAALASSAGSLREEASDREDRLRAISAELTRIADRLVAVVDPGLTVSGAIPTRPLSEPESGASPSGGVPADMPAVGADAYRRIIRGRRMRDLYLGDGLFSDPAWDILLDLAAARLEATPVAVSSLCIAAAVPPTTALRWIRALTERGLLVRTPDAQDGRRVFVTLSTQAADAMGGYVRAVQMRDAA